MKIEKIIAHNIQKHCKSNIILLFLLDSWMAKGEIGEPGYIGVSGRPGPYGKKGEIGSYGPAYELKSMALYKSFNDLIYRGGFGLDGRPGLKGIVGSRGIKGERGPAADWAEPGEQGKIELEILKKNRFF